jgi:hypothetical protein
MVFITRRVYAKERTEERRGMGEDENKKSLLSLYIHQCVPAGIQKSSINVRNSTYQTKDFIAIPDYFSIKLTQSFFRLHKS